MSSARQAMRPTLRPPPRPRGLAVVPVVPQDEPAGDLDTMVDLPRAAPVSDIRELAVRRPPRPTPRKPPEPKHATTSPLRPPPPLPVSSKREPATTQEADTIELDASCIEEACALASAAPVSTSQRFAGFLGAVAFFVLFIAMAAGRWLRATFVPAARAVAADARARLVIEWERASRSARKGYSPSRTGLPPATPGASASDGPASGESSSVDVDVCTSRTSRARSSPRRT